MQKRSVALYKVISDDFADDTKQSLLHKTLLSSQTLVIVEVLKLTLSHHLGLIKKISDCSSGTAAAPCLNSIWIKQKHRKLKAQINMGEMYQVFTSMEENKNNMIKGVPTLK